MTRYTLPTSTHGWVKGLLSPPIMSRHPSPAPSNPAAQPLSALRQKQKPFAVGSAAGADDVIYQAKYKELKRKVKDIESDNDKLHIKVMNARVSIQRMKMERAILYERLSIVPPFPAVQERGAQSHLAQSLPPPRPVSATHHRHDSRDHPSMETDQPLKDYIRSSGDRVNTGTDGRLGPVTDLHAGPGMALSHMSAVHSPRRSSAGHDGSRHHLPQMGQLPPAQRYESSRAHSHSNSHASPPLHHPHASSSHSRTRSHSSSRSRSHQLPAQSYHGGSSHPTQYPESLIPAQQVLHSPASIERERSRRHDFNDLSASHDDPRHVHHQAPLAQMSPRSDIRSSSYIQPQHRVGHATFINSSRDDLQERHRDLERDREWERERERDRHDSGRGREIDTHSASRSRQLIDRTDYKVSSRSREEQAYYADGPLPTGYTHPSRSGSPGSDSASGSAVGAGEDPPRSDSRSQFYERDHSRSSSYRLRPVTNEDIDFVHEDGRSYSRDHRTGGGMGGGSGNFALAEQSRTLMDGRKRSRNDMDVVSDNDAEGPHGDSLYSTGRLQEDRGSVKRHHRERHHQHRSDDNHEDNRMTS